MDEPKPLYIIKRDAVMSDLRNIFAHNDFMTSALYDEEFESWFLDHVHNNLELYECEDVDGNEFIGYNLNSRDGAVEYCSLIFEDLVAFIISKMTKEGLVEPMWDADAQEFVFRIAKDQQDEGNE